MVLLPMPKMPDIIPITDLRMEAYELGERERQILHILAAGEREIAKGKGRELAAVLAAADQMLRDVNA